MTPTKIKDSAVPEVRNVGRRRRVDLDIWMSAEEFCGRGYGPDAIETLVGHLHRTLGVREFSVDPSARNSRAIRAYQKAGFIAQERGPPDKNSDYRDTLAMRKTINTEQQGGGYSPPAARPSKPTA